jgi:CHAD domain-containing protein
MGRHYRIKPKKNLRENAQLMIPGMLEDFLGHRNRVLGHPLLRDELHRMRIDGKSLRYAMEVFDVAFGAEFRTCLEQIKQLLDTMGDVHDCDVIIPKLQAHLRTVRIYNRSVATVSDTVPTGALVTLIRGQRELRKSLFEKMSTTIEEWTRADFRGKVENSMQPII